MKLSYHWLKELINFKLSPEKLAEVLNLKIAAVEKIEKFGEGLDKVIVGEILEIKPHPSADKLQIVKVKTRIRNQELGMMVVCGAFNIKVGDKVPLALPGAKLANGAIIQESVIRGIKSEGMLCAEDELGVGEDHTGILILDKSAKIGEKISKTLGLDDTIIEIENSALTHRPDLFGHIGCAREVAVVTNSKLKSQNSRPKFKTQNLVNLRIKIENYRDCSRYMAVVMDGIKVGPSPIWLQNRLRNLGIRPINNVVDITNYVMVEIGQPLHAFDFYKLEISGQKLKIINIRRAKKDEKLLCLDGIERNLDEEILVIADTKKPIALAGIMGGEESGITEKTKTIIIESANFHPVVIRKGARKAGLHTEASLRFEKGLPLIFAQQGVLRAIELIEKIAGGKVVSKIYDAKNKKTEKLLKTTKKIRLDIQKVSDLIGEKISEKQIIEYLTSLEFDVKKTGKKLSVNIPSHRPDIEYPEDVIEEISRLFGYQKIIPAPIEGKFTIVPQDPLLALEKNLKNILVGLGFDEVYNYSFYGQDLIDLLKLPKEPHLEIANPLNPAQRYLRISLVPKLLENAAKNVSFFEHFKIFEIGKIYRSQTNAEIDTDKHRIQRQSALSQRKSALLVEQPKYLAGLVLEKKEKIFYLVKGIVETVLEKIGLEKERICYQIAKEHKFSCIDYLTEILVDRKVIGTFGEINKNVRDNLKILAEVGIFEINLEILKDLKIPSKTFKEISPYPSILRDLAFLVPKNIVFEELFQAIKNFHPLIYLVEPFDVFESEKLGKDVRNIAFHLIFQSFNRTLKSEEIDKIINDLVKTLEQKFGVKLRTF